MQPEQTFTTADAGHAPLACPGCQATMLRGMRFCRFCGYRLGEGVEEYAETIRLPGSANPSARGATTAAQHGPTAGVPHAWGPMQPSSVETSALNGLRGATPARSWRCKGRMKWPVVVALSIAFATAAGFMPFFKFKVNDGVPVVVQRPPRSYFGVNNFSDYRGDTFEGALIDYVAPPGSPADVAGLVGGDVVTFFDGQTVASDEDLVELLRETPTGKTVEVIYVRDGETRRTTLTTASRGDIDKLSKAYARRPEGKGFFGIEETDDLKRVLAPGLNVYGVQLEGLLKNRPAYIAGLRDGDILVEFGGVPVRTAAEFGARIKRAVPDSTIKIVVVRRGERVEIPFKVGSLN